MNTANTLAVEPCPDGSRLGVAKTEKQRQGSSSAMSWVAMRMLTGDRAKYLALIFAISFSAFLITQQALDLRGNHESNQIADRLR